mgnify:CR=1 FL=1
MSNFKIAASVFFVLIISRIIPHPPNFTTLLALSFYVPAILGIRFIPVVVLSFLLTDLYFGFHSVVLLFQPFNQANTENIDADRCLL